MDKRTSPLRSCLRETHVRWKDTLRLNMKGRNRCFLRRETSVQVRVATLTSDERDFKTKAIKRGEEDPGNPASGYCSRETRNAKRVHRSVVTPAETGTQPERRPWTAG